MKNVKTYFLLYILLLGYSLADLFSKLASNTSFLSLEFCLYYGMVILILGIYAIVWQQIIRRLPLSKAYANRAVTLLWGLIWGIIFFNEEITLFKVIGLILVIIGIVIYSLGDKEVDHE